MSHICHGTFSQHNLVFHLRLNMSASHPNNSRLAQTKRRTGERKREKEREREREREREGGGGRVGGGETT